MVTDAVDVTRRADRASRLVVAHVTVAKAARSGSVWGVVFGGYFALQSTGYATSYKTLADRVALAKEFGTNAGISALVGPARHIDTVAGFTAWKCLMVLAVAGSVWGMLTSTRLLRAEEDAGRWEVLLAGRTTRARATAQAVVGLFAGVATLFVVSAVLTVAVGRTSKIGFATSNSLYFCVATVAAPIMFLAVGALSSQLAATRRQASSYAAAFLGLCFAVRMVADSGTGLTWMRWLSPLGWIEELRPLTGSQPLALIPIIVFTAALGVAAVTLAAKRDLGSSWLPDHSSATARTALLNGPGGLTVRLLRPTLVAWTIAIVGYGLLLGSIAKSGGKAIVSSPSLRRAFARLGVSGPEAYVGIALLIMAVTLAFVAVGQISAARGEESSGRSEFLLVRPVARSRWLLVRTGVAVMALTVLGLLAGLATWVGAASEHAGIGLVALVEAGINIVPANLVLLGVGVALFGLWPRAAVRVTYAVLVWSLLVELVGGVVPVNHWILDSSTYHQMTAAPSASVNWTVNAVMASLGAAMMALGIVAFNRRDLKNE
jgi:ABC-2 type transport system permease protein